VTTRLKAMMPAERRDGSLARASAKTSATTRRRFETADDTGPWAPPPLRARSVSLETSRAGLWRCLARDPTVSRSVGLVL
jgi:hypothetical protein